MDAELVIRSRQNSLLKRVGAVGAGKEADRFLLEGERLIRDALGGGVELEVVLVAEDQMGLAGALAADGAEVRLVEADLLQQVSTLQTSPGSLALGITPRQRAVESMLWRMSAVNFMFPNDIGTKARVVSLFIFAPQA